MSCCSAAIINYKIFSLSYGLKVLYIEQLLTTGGGWQDQVGGIMGGCNLGTINKD